MITDISGDRDRRLEELTAIWEASVRATHDFLSEADISALKPLVRDGLREIPTLLIVLDGDGAAGFMGIAGDRLEMLFLHPAARGKGFGGMLAAHAIGFGVKFVDVNEQNPAARAFYEHCGFRVRGRSPLDAQGNPFPILHMQLR